MAASSETLHNIHHGFPIAQTIQLHRHSGAPTIAHLQWSRTQIYGRVSRWSVFSVPLDLAESTLQSQPNQDG